jgi:glutamate synthase domain-containing protein 3
VVLSAVNQRLSTRKWRDGGCRAGEPLVIEAAIKNTHRATGTQLSYEISKRFGEAGLPEGSVTVNLHGHAGQSLGAWLTKGVAINLTGDANDYVGKGLSGGVISVRYLHSVCCFFLSK